MTKQLFITVGALLCSFVTLSQTYATSLTSCNSSGVCLGGSACTNSANVVDANLTNFGTMSTGIGVACTRSLVVGFSSTRPSGSYVGFYIDDGNVAAVLGNVSMTTYSSGTPVETVSGGSLVSLLSGGRRASVSDKRRQL